MIQIEIRALQFDWDKCSQCNERVMGVRTCECGKDHKFPPPRIRRGHAYAIQTWCDHRNAPDYVPNYWIRAINQRIFRWDSKAFQRLT